MTIQRQAHKLKVIGIIAAIIVAVVLIAQIVYVINFNDKHSLELNYKPVGATELRQRILEGTE